jgi:hypothetical protein
MNFENQDCRVHVLQDRIIYVRELEHPSPEGISESATHIANLARDWDFFSIIVEFPSIAVPDPLVRERVVQEMLPFKTRLRHVAVVSEPNIVLKVAIKFISAFSGFTSITLHTTRESALQTILDKARPLGS